MRIYDCFLFDGELTLLEHRLAEVYDLVDVFIIVEAARTYRDQPKPLTFAEHRERFAWAAEKLRPIALQGLGGSDTTPRQRAAVQRNAMLLALRDAEPDDVVLILDADEIPSRSVLQRLRTHGLSGPSRLAMTRHYEFIDRVGPRSPCCPTPGEPFPTATGRPRPEPWEELSDTWYGHSGIAVRYRDLSGDPATGLSPRTPFDLRFRTHDVPVIRDAGRHFTSVDPSARLERKLGRVFHAEYADARGMSLPHLLRCRRHGLHHRGWWYAERPPGPLPGDLARLAERSPELMAPPVELPYWRRRVARSWAWLRFSPWVPSRLVQRLDRHFETLMPLLAPPLLLADGLRAVTARGARRFGKYWPAPASSGHHS